MKDTNWNFLPYTFVDGVPTLRDSEIIYIYEKCFEDGIGDLLFHDGSINSAEEFLSHVKQPNVLFWIIYYQGELLGFFWLNRLETTCAYCHFAGFPKFWGTGLTVKAGKKAMAIVLRHFNVIMGMLPSDNNIAINYLYRVGLKKVGEVPNLLWSKAKGKPVKGTILYITGEDLNENF